LDQETVLNLEKEQAAAPHLRLLQKEIAKQVTIMVHGDNEYNMAVKASEILFGKSSTEDLAALDERTFLQVFDGVPQAEISKSEFESAANVVDLLSEKTNGLIFPSKGEARKMIQGGGVLINKEKISDPNSAVSQTLLQGKYLLVQKGKKQYYIISVKP
jgi:tyrosyl-tRNA synthetase